MSNDSLSAVSAAHRENVRSALVAAFGYAPIGAITPIGGGASTASTFRLEVRDRRYLLRVEGKPSPLRNPHQYVSMRIAAEAGIAPNIHHVDEEDRIAVIDFIERQPLKASSPPVHPPASTPRSDMVEAVAGWQICLRFA